QRSIPRIKAADTACNNLRFPLDLACFGVDGDNQSDHSLISHLFPLSHSLAFNLVKSTIVDKGPPDLSFADHDCSFAIQLEDIAVFDKDDIFLGVSEMVLHKLQI